MKVLNEEGKKELFEILNSICMGSFLHLRTILEPNLTYEFGSPLRKAVIEIAIPDRFWEEREDVLGEGILSYEFLEDIDFKEFVEDIPAKRRKSRKEVRP